MLTCVKELKLSINAIGISITSIIKNNAGQFYWPEFNANQIGDFIPGQGYLLNIFNPIPSYYFTIFESFIKFILSFGEIINSSNFPYLIKILSKEGAGDEIILLVLDISFIRFMSIGR